MTRMPNQFPSRLPGQSPATLEEDIRRTRAELGVTIAALQRKLVARHFVDEGYDMLKDSFAGADTVNRGLDIVRANPIPVALVGIGAAWLIAANTGVVDRIANERHVDAARRRASDLAGDIGNRAGAATTAVTDRIGLTGTDNDYARAGVTGNAMIDGGESTRPTSWVHKASDMAGEAMRSTRDSAEATLNTVSSFASEQATTMTDTLRDAFRRNPLVVGIIGLMAGALLASVLPATRAEDELLGNSRDELWQKAGEAGYRAAIQAREVAARAAEAAVEATEDAARNTGAGRAT